MSNARPLILVLSIAVFGLLIPIVHAAESFGTTDLASQVADAKRDGNWRRAGDIVLAAFGDDGLGGLDDAAALALYETGSATLSALDDASGSLALDEMALAEFANREFEEGIRRATLNLASSYFWGDELEQARALAGQLMASSPRDAGDNDIYVGAASVRAHIDRTDKNYDECIALLQPVVDAPDAFPGVDPNTWFIVHRGLSLCYRYQGVANDYDMAALERAARYAEAAVRYAQRDPEPTATSLSIALESLARVQWELGRQDDAIRNQQQAAGLLESQGLDTGRDYSIIASLLSIYLARNDRFDEALEYARRGTAAGREHYLRAFFGPGKPTANDTIYIAYAANAFFEALKAREDSGEPATPEELDAVFDYAQFSATTEIGQSLKITAAQASSRSAALRAYRDARKKMQNRWLELSTEIGYLASDSTAFAETLAARTEEKQRLTRRLTTQQARASADVSSYLGLWGTDSVSIAALQDVLAADELLLHISSIYSYVTVIAITRDDVHWYRPAFENDEFCELARRHRASLSATTDLDCEDRIVAITPTFRELQPFDFAANATLYGRLFAPAVEALGDKPKWIVSANGLASTLALPALLRQPVSEAELASRGFADLPWLGRETALFLAPRMSALVAWRSGVRDEPNDDRASRLVAVAGAPCIGRFTGAACARQAVALDDESVVFQNPEGPVLRRGKSDDLSFESLSRLPELPAAMTELRRIAAAGDSPVSLVGDALTKPQFRDALQDRGGILAIATHALAAGELGIDQPALLLTPSPEADAEQALLSAGEIAQLSLPYDWILLSGCHTGGPDGDRRSAVFTGLALGFLQAGAKALLVTQFEVQDASSANLVPEFVGQYLRNRESGKAGALQSSIDRLLRDADRTALHHPRHWAGYAVLGAAPEW